MRCSAGWHDAASLATASASASVRECAWRGREGARGGRISSPTALPGCRTRGRGSREEAHQCQCVPVLKGSVPGRCGWGGGRQAKQWARPSTQDCAQLSKGAEAQTCTSHPPCGRTTVPGRPSSPARTRSGTMSSCNSSAQWRPRAPGLALRGHTHIHRGPSVGVVRPTQSRQWPRSCTCGVQRICLVVLAVTFSESQHHRPFQSQARHVSWLAHSLQHSLRVHTQHRRRRCRTPRTPVRPHTHHSTEAKPSMASEAGVRFLGVPVVRVVRVP